MLSLAMSLATHMSTYMTKKAVLLRRPVQKRSTATPSRMFQRPIAVMFLNVPDPSLSCLLKCGSCLLKCSKTHRCHTFSNVPDPSLSCLLECSRPIAVMPFQMFQTHCCHAFSNVPYPSLVLAVATGTWTCSSFTYVAHRHANRYVCSRAAGMVPRPIR